METMQGLAPPAECYLRPIHSEREEENLDSSYASAGVTMPALKTKVLVLNEKPPSATQHHPILSTAHFARHFPVLCCIEMPGLIYHWKAGALAPQGGTLSASKGWCAAAVAAVSDNEAAPLLLGRSFFGVKCRKAFQQQ